MRATRTSRGANFSSAEVLCLLQICRQKLPLGQEEWVVVQNLYNRNAPAGRKRSAESIKDKFKALKNKLKPTGSGEIPYEIQEAKEIGKLMESRQVVVTFDSTEGNVDNNFISPNIRNTTITPLEVPTNNDVTDLQNDFDNDVFDFINPSQDILSQTQNDVSMENFPSANTTKRTGLTEDQLKHLSVQISVNEVTIKKCKIDEALEKLNKNEGNDNFLNLWLIKQTEIEERRMMREEKQAAEIAKREEENIRRAEERNAKEEEAKRQHELIMMEMRMQNNMLLAKIFSKND